MKRRDLVQHLEAHGCELLCEGGRHTIYVNRASQAVSAVPRHQEVNNILARSRLRPNAHCSRQGVLPLGISEIMPRR